MPDENKPLSDAAAAEPINPKGPDDKSAGQTVNQTGSGVTPADGSPAPAEPTTQPPVAPTTAEPARTDPPGGEPRPETGSGDADHGPGAEGDVAGADSGSTSGIEQEEDPESDEDLVTADADTPVADPAQRDVPEMRPPAARPRDPTIPPARVAGVAGDPGYVPDYDPGRSMGPASTPAVVPVSSAPQDTQMPTMTEGITITPARYMDAGQARSTLAKMVADMQTWVSDFPHQVEGEPAHVLQYMRGLAQRRRARADAAAHGQDIPEDPIDAAEHLPPPEATELGEMCQEAAAIIRQYEQAIAASGANISLTGEDQQRVDAFKRRLRLHGAVSI